MEGALSQLQSLALRNGYNRPGNVIPRQNKQNWTAVHGGPGAMNYTMHMVDPSQVPMRNSTKAGSDSGGSSTGEASPPPIQPDPVAGLHGNANQTQSSGSLRNKQPLNLSRLNGGKNGAGGSSSSSSIGSVNNNNNNTVDFNNGPQTLVTSSSSGNLPLLIGGPMYNFPTYRTMPHPRHFQTQPNGELIYAFPQPTFLPTPTAVVVKSASPSNVTVPTPYPTNKMVQSCFNCGSINHTGVNCSEASMEDVTRNAVYKLDYTFNTPQIQLTSATMTPSASSSSLNQTSAALPANNNEPEPALINDIIDLTQDTTSSSSSSSTSSIHGAK